MPKYKVKTDQGAFAVELDQEPQSTEQLNSLVASHLAGGAPQAQAKAPENSILSSVGEFVMREGPKMAGAAIGGTLGSSLGPAGTIGGAGLGASAVGTIQDMLGQLFGGERRTGFAETAGRRLEDVVSGGLQVAAPALKMSGTGRVKPLMKTHGTPEEREAVKFGLRAKIPIDAPTATNNRVLQASKSVGRELPIAGNILEKGDIRMREALVGKGRELAQRVAPKGTGIKQEAGAGVVASLNTRTTRLGEAESRAFKTLERIAREPANVKKIVTRPAETVMDEFGKQTAIPEVVEDVAGATDISKVKAALQPILDEIKSTIPQAQRDASPGFTALKQIIDSPDIVPIKKAIADLSSIQGISRGADNPLVRNKSQGIAAKITQLYRSAIDQAAGDMGQEATNALRVGRSATRGKYAVAALKKQISPSRLGFEKEPVKVVDFLIANEDKSIQTLNNLRKQAPGSIRNIARSFLEGVMDKATEKGKFSGEVAANAYQKLGDKTKDLLFKDKAHIADLDNFFRLSRLAAKEVNPSGSGRIAALAATAGVTFNNPITGAKVILTTSVLAKALESPRFAKALVEGFRTPASAKQAKDIFSRLTPWLANGSQED